MSTPENGAIRRFFGRTARGATNTKSRINTGLIAASLRGHPEHFPHTCGKTVRLFLDRESVFAHCVL
jgi:hypothetical protein